MNKNEQTNIFFIDLHVATCNNPPAQVSSFKFFSSPLSKHFVHQPMHQHYHHLLISTMNHHFQYCTIDLSSNSLTANLWCCCWASTGTTTKRKSTCWAGTTTKREVTCSACSLRSQSRLLINSTKITF